MALESNVHRLDAHDLAQQAAQDVHPRPDVCIIGAGSSGVTVAKALRERGVAFDCFEKGWDIGGMWRYQNDNGQSSAYASLHIDTSRDNLGYSDSRFLRTCPTSCRMRSF
jgi:dimethylaniline monooxygenase (N-oxide forming)